MTLWNNFLSTYKIHYYFILYDEYNTILLTDLQDIFLKTDSIDVKKIYYELSLNKEEKNLRCMYKFIHEPNILKKLVYSINNPREQATILEKYGHNFVNQFQDDILYFRINFYVENETVLCQLIPDRYIIDIDKFDYILKQSKKYSANKILSHKLTFNLDNFQFQGKDWIDKMLNICYKYGDCHVANSFRVHNMYPNRKDWVMNGKKLYKLNVYKHSEMFFFVKNLQKIGHIDIIFENIISYFFYKDNIRELDPQYLYWKEDDHEDDYDDYWD
jgi:hypothetical protein